MKTVKIILLLLTFSVLFGCVSKVSEVKTTFDGPFPKRSKNLMHTLGNSFLLKTWSDTISYLVDFRKSDRYNFIIEEETRDTIFQGTICKYRGLYYLNEKINDTTFLIYAIEIYNETIKGLNTKWIQMSKWNEHLEFWLTQEGQEKINSKPSFIICADPTKRIIRLDPDKKELRKFYSAILDSLEPDTILNWVEPIVESPIIKETTKIKEGLTEQLELINNVYPNPAKDHCIIEFNDIDLYYFGLYDETGKLLKRGMLKNKKNKIDLTELNNGIYYIRVHSDQMDDLETIKLIKN